MVESQEEKKKIHRCKYTHIELSDCVYKCKYNHLKEITEKDCEECVNFKSRFIEYPIQVDKVENDFSDDGYYTRNCGKLVKVRPCCDSGEKEKTYLGIYLGEQIIGCSTGYNSEKHVLTNRAFRNPAIFVPELSKIVYGCESWWGFIENTEEIKDITDEDIENQWYVQLLKGNKNEVS